MDIQQLKADTIRAQHLNHLVEEAKWRDEWAAATEKAQAKYDIAIGVIPDIIKAAASNGTFSCVIFSFGSEYSEADRLTYRLLAAKLEAWAMNQGFEVHVIKDYNTRQLTVSW